MGHREAKKERLRQEIRDAALTLFRERGVDQTRVQDIAARVGISEGTFFNYFPTKDAVLADHAGKYLEAYHDLLEYEVARTDMPVPDRLREVGDVLAASFSDDRDFVAVTVGRTGLLIGTEEPMTARTKAAYTQLEALFACGQRDGDVRDDIDAAQLAEVFTGTYIITITNWLFRWWPDDTDLESRLRGAIDVFLAGATASSARRGTASRGRPLTKS